MNRKSEISIGVLALQGAFNLHKSHIEALGAKYVEVVNREDFDSIDGLILPGGESAVMLRLIDIVGIKERLGEFLATKPSWGICAGAILMAKSVVNPAQFSFGAIDIAIERNAYGRQLESFQKKIDDYEVSFIRAPKILSVGQGATVLSKREGSPTWVQSNLSMVTTFHPETNLNFPSPIHRRFYESIPVSPTF